MAKLRNKIAVLSVVLALLVVSGVFAQNASSTQVQTRRGIVDANNDGICDITGRTIGSGAGLGQGRQAMNGRRNGPGDGTGNQGVGPQDGTGYGTQSGKRLGLQNGSGIGRTNSLGNGAASSRGRMRRGGGR